MWVNPTQSDPTCNPIYPNPFLTRLKWSVFDPWPVWPITWLTRLNPTQLARFAMSMLTYWFVKWANRKRAMLNAISSPINNSWFYLSHHVKSLYPRPLFMLSTSLSNACRMTRIFSRRLSFLLLLLLLLLFLYFFV